MMCLIIRFSLRMHLSIMLFFLYSRCIRSDVPPHFDRYVVHSLVFCVVFCRSLLFFCQLYSLRRIMVFDCPFGQGRHNNITGPRAKQCTGVHTYATTHRNKTVNVYKIKHIYIQYTTYIDKHGAPMLVSPRATSPRAHALRRHWIHTTPTSLQC